jgi:hypothetical protein
MLESKHFNELVNIKVYNILSLNAKFYTTIENNPIELDISDWELKYVQIGLGDVGLIFLMI